jgi:flagellum-specific peptidoglycan hydrolase FlgJ
MKQPNLIARLAAYWKSNWFKIILFGIILFVLIQRDFSFQINVQSNEPTSPASPSFKKEAGSKKGKITDAALANHEQEKTLLEIMSLPLSTKKSSELETALAGIDDEARSAFFRRFGHVSINERKKFGIPSSIILANGLLHSLAGKQEYTRQGKNYFALPCTANWQGETGRHSGACYRHYNSAWLSFRDHSLFITTGEFAALKNLPPTDYKGWAKGLEKLNFSSVEGLADLLIRIIEKHELHMYDTD